MKEQLLKLTNNEFIIYWINLLDNEFFTSNAVLFTVGISCLIMAGVLFLKKSYYLLHLVFMLGGIVSLYTAYHNGQYEAYNKGRTEAFKILEVRKQTPTSYELD